ncbi:MAG: hypothetical protein CR988_01365 [Treponema sp.]|nr:MAG: hypothetical protein CR988_01365 [Treponema sp.]
MKKKTTIPQKPTYYGNANRFSSLQLKNIAIIAMVIDHIAFACLRPMAIESPVTSNIFLLYTILRAIGRLTMPLMVFCLVEGFCYTSNLRKYLIRLFLFALVSHFPYVFFHLGNFGFNISTIRHFRTSIIANLFLALLTLSIDAKTKLPNLTKAFITLLLLILSWFCDWSFYPIILALIFYYLRPFAILKLPAYILTIPVWIALHNWAQVVADLSQNGILTMFNGSIKTTVTQFTRYYHYQLFFAGLLLVPPLLFFYNGKAGKQSTALKYFFYIFYPTHLLIIGWIKFGSPF